VVVFTFSNLEFAGILVYYISVGLNGWEVLFAFADFV